jgi:hypothetical protein
MIPPTLYTHYSRQVKDKVPESAGEIPQPVVLIIFFNWQPPNLIDKRQAAINNEYLLR